MPSVSPRPKSSRGNHAPAQQTPHKPRKFRQRKRKPRPQRPPRPPITLAELKSELHELTTALGCVKPLASMAHALSCIIPRHQGEAFDIKDIIDLEDAARLMANSARIRLLRLIETMTESGLRLEA